eukprot:GEMP01110600.1.p1 GENE.GEMP01110600.1~~GEMP01110600.1.p1  ORF type:complete len:179 (+),score=46.70 GEMP01110600.1:123-659(+)
MFRAQRILARARKFRETTKIAGLNDPRIYQTKALELKYPHYKTRTWSRPYACINFHNDPTRLPYAHVEVLVSYRGFADAPVHDLCRAISQSLQGIDIALDSSDFVVVGKNEKDEDITEYRPSMRRINDGKEIDLSSVLSKIAGRTVTKDDRIRVESVIDGAKLNEQCIWPVIEQLKEL